MELRWGGESLGTLLRVRFGLPIMALLSLFLLEEELLVAAVDFDDVFAMIIRKNRGKYKLN